MFIASGENVLLTIITDQKCTEYNYITKYINITDNR